MILNFLFTVKQCVILSEAKNLMLRAMGLRKILRFAQNDTELSFHTLTRNPG